MPSQCDIIFDRPNGIYHSGENLNGSIQLRTNKSKTIRGISLQINGYAKVRWTEIRVDKNRRAEIKEFTAYHEYINSVTFVVGSYGQEPFDLATGTYNHLFHYSLPLSLPTSFEGQYGEIKYNIIVTIARPFSYDNIFKQGFTVIQPANLNLDTTLKFPKIIEDFEFAFCCCCCCGCGKISADLKIPFGGYAPGQKIHYQMFVVNDTEHDLDKVDMKLENRLTFESSSPYQMKRHIEHEIYSKSFSPILRLTRKEFKDTIQLPAISPSSTDPEQIIRNGYLLTGTVVTGCCANNIILATPIIIGTVPIIESPTNIDNVITQQPTAPVLNFNNDLDLPPNYSSVGASPPYEYTMSLALASPSYEDSWPVTGKFEKDVTDLKHIELPFTPKYPVYYNFTGIPNAPELRKCNYKQLLSNYPDDQNTGLATSPSDDDDVNITLNENDNTDPIAMSSTSVSRTYGWAPSDKL